MLYLKFSFILVACHAFLLFGLFFLCGVPVVQVCACIPEFWYNGWLVLRFHNSYLFDDPFCSHIRAERNEFAFTISELIMCVSLYSNLFGSSLFFASIHCEAWILLLRWASSNWLSLNSRMKMKYDSLNPAMGDFLICEFMNQFFRTVDAMRSRVLKRNWCCVC